MDKKRLELIVTAVLVVIFILILSNSLKKAKAKSSPEQAQVPATPAPARSFTPSVETNLERVKMLKEEEEAAWGRNPFVLQEIAPVTVDSISNLKVNGITTGKDGTARAFINNEIVSAGSTIGKFTILKISSNRVTVTDGEKNYILEMK